MIRCNCSQTVRSPVTKSLCLSLTVAAGHGWDTKNFRQLPSSLGFLPAGQHRLGVCLSCEGREPKQKQPWWGASSDVRRQQGSQRHPGGVPQIAHLSLPNRVKPTIQLYYHSKVSLGKDPQTESNHAGDTSQRVQTLFNLVKHQKIRAPLYIEAVVLVVGW